MADEYLFLEPKAVGVIAPMLANGGVSVFVSSVDSAGEANPLRQILYTKDREGENLFFTLNWLKSCDACRMAGKGARCMHVSSPPQFYQSRYGQERVKGMLSVIEGAYEREMHNVSDEPDSMPAFAIEHVNRMFELQRRDGDPAEEPIFFVGIDPAGGVRLSEYAIISACFKPSEMRPGRYDMTILACDVANSSDNDVVASIVLEQIRGVRDKILGMHSARAVLAVESNLPTIATEIHRRVARRTRDVFSIQEDLVQGGGGEPQKGSRTTLQNKPDMIEELNILLKDGRIRFHEKFFTARPDTLGDRYHSARELIRKHLLGFNKHLIRNERKPHDAPKVSYSGKGPSSNDDCTMVLAILAYIYPRIRQKAHRVPLYQRIFRGTRVR